MAKPRDPLKDAQAALQDAVEAFLLYPSPSLWRAAQTAARVVLRLSGEMPRGHEAQQHAALALLRKHGIMQS